MVLINIFTPINGKSITDYSKIKSYKVAAIHAPKTIEELRLVVLKAKKPIAIAGGRFSHGGHIAYPNGTVIDITKLKNITYFDPQAKKITVQAGATWRRVQKYIDPYNLAVTVMQSYNDFTVGGSLSVNVHGRDNKFGQIIETVDAITVMLADGSLVRASRTENPDLFAGIIGGYGAMGIIIDATFNLCDNVPMEQVMYRMNAKEYQNFFFKNIHGNPNIIMHNANLYPSEYKEIISIAWEKPKRLVCPNKLNTGIRKKSAYYPDLMIMGELLRTLSPMKKVRPDIEYAARSTPTFEMRNYQMSYSVNMHAILTHVLTTYILQEYFVPVKSLNKFIAALQYINKKHGPNILNASIRYVPKNTDSLLTYAPVDSFAIVLYLNIANSSYGTNYAKKWTQELIDKTLQLGGTYYLPYQPYATRTQFQRAYPRWQQFLAVKQKYDPKNVFSNHFILKYISAA